MLLRTRLILGISALTFLLVHSDLFAQQKPHYTQYVMNQYIINPAFSGIENYTDIKLSHRQQWQGLEGAPVTTYFTLHTPLGKSDYKTNATSFSVDGFNPRGKSYYEEYEAAAPHHGVGVQVINDQAGPFNNFAAYGTYAYHLGISSRTNFSAGFGVGISRMNLNTSKLDFGNGVNIDPAIRGSGEIGKTQLDLNAGLLLYSADYFFGASMQQIIPQPLEFANNTLSKTKGKRVPHLFGIFGYRFLISEDINMVPSVMVKYVSSVPVQADVNLKFQYRELLWAGASYRSQYGFAAMAGLRALRSLMISYSYDYTTTRLNTVSNGSHEIILGFMIGNKYNQETCPRNVW
ncbi:MAG: type IX secretion system membrane protein PorP/SprF [Bacteroidota bacterium]